MKIHSNISEKVVQNRTIARGKASELQLGQRLRETEKHFQIQKPVFSSSVVTIYVYIICIFHSGVSSLAGCQLLVCQ